MPKKNKGGLLGLLLGTAAAIGAAVFLSKKENRQKVAKVAKKASKQAKTVAKKAKTVARKATAKVKTASKKRITTRRKKK